MTGGYPLVKASLSEKLTLEKELNDLRHSAFWSHHIESHRHVTFELGILF